jgi:hypothetical protein
VEDKPQPTKPSETSLAAVWLVMRPKSAWAEDPINPLIFIARTSRAMTIKGGRTEPPA